MPHILHLAHSRCVHTVYIILLPEFFACFLIIYEIRRQYGFLKRVLTKHTRLAFANALELHVDRLLDRLLCPFIQISFVRGIFIPKVY